MKKLNETYNNGNFNLCEFALIRGYINKILDMIMVKLEKILKNKKLITQNISEV